MTALTKLLDKAIPTGFIVRDFVKGASTIQTYSTAPNINSRMLERVNKVLTGTYQDNYLIITRPNMYIVCAWEDTQGEYDAYYTQLTYQTEELLQIKKLELAKMQELVDTTKHMVAIKPKLDTDTVSILNTIKEH